MNVFDFDGTLYRGDSTLDFWLYSTVRHPACLLALPRQLFAAAQYAAGRISRETFKEHFYGFLRHIPNTSQAVVDFWNARQTKLRSDVLARISEGDLVASASPEFLLSEICRRRHWELIASEVDPRTGQLLGPNCRGSEKVARIQKAGYTERFDQGYSDSLSDAPLMTLTQEAFLVRKHQIAPFPSNKSASN